MIRNLKALGLPLCAVFMFGALSVSTASAVTDVLTAAETDNNITGSQIGGIGAGNEFSTKWEPNAKIECTTGAYAGTFVSNPPFAVELTPSYTGCKAAGLNATVTDNDIGCKYVLTGFTHAFTKTDGTANADDSTVRLNCNDAGNIAIEAPFGCVITLRDTHPASIPVNQNLLGVKYDNEKEVATGKWDVKVTVTIDKITYTSTGACQALGITATDSDGYMTTNITLRSYEDAGHSKQVNLTWS